MFELKNILAIVDFRQEEHFALPRAIELSKLFGCKLTVLSNTYESFMEFIPSGSAIDHELIKKEAMEHETKRLKETTQKFDIENINIDYFVTWDRYFHKGLSEFINKQSFDLVVKTARKHNAIEKILFTPTDWHLLRDTKTNILFVKTEKWPSNSSILGAINIEDDSVHKKLNTSIIQTTVDLSNALNCKSNIINVFPWPAVKLDRFNHLFDKKDLFLEIKQKHTESVNAVVNNIAKVTGKTLIAEGLEVEEAIPKMAKSLYSKMLVMGTVGRSGLQGAVIGNTAEKILDQLECEVLTIK